MYPDKTADILRGHQWFPCEMTSGKQAHKFHTDYTSIQTSYLLLDCSLSSFKAVLYGYYKQGPHFLHP